METRVYTGVGNAFFNDTRSDGYNRPDAEDAWNWTLALFRRYLA